MGPSSHILLLSGSFEARRVAEGLAAAGVRFTAVLSEAPRGPSLMPQPPVLRRFEDASALAAFVREAGVTAVLDASHVFDRRLTAQAVAACAQLSLPYLRLERPAWPTDPPHCTSAPDAHAAFAAAGARVFAATGWDSLPAMQRFGGEVVFLRQTRRHDRPAPVPFVTLSFGDPPFDTAQERALFAELRIDTLIARNLGGTASRPKIDAARALGIRTILIDRPALPAEITITSAPERAIAWAST
ncbi:precorrin-6A/cobalt-precorrin-6A reductase [Sulfitobacter albidus]|uniref:Precorrin-6A/cobalt-precorrin-6A reductase n=1 Tax=Sulfitobacter albidus TaxID=2829501 RepID=A0A975JGG5_9RHOB|nr:precorrin-6A/cobalt-precorrin-6A reductase [Sulfitobacter albidus]QUJ77815.1 precorrin-6A/cobalt-precorrin-6A reductase [Sulfitobacter albidus]